MFEMLRRVIITAILAGLVMTATVAATLSPQLASKLGGLANTANVGFVIVSFNTSNGLSVAHLDVLRGVGVTKGITLNRLGMVGIPATAVRSERWRLTAVCARSGPTNGSFTYNDEARVLTGVDRVRTDPAFTQAHGGLPISGQGNFSVVINDSGIDATHDDLRFPNHVIQNVQILTDTETLTGFTPLLAIENVPNTDLNVGHAHALRGDRRRHGSGFRRSLCGRRARR